MRLDSVSRSSWIFFGLALRIILLGWGAYQDSTSTVPYTDIDYYVFTSASRYLISACPLEDIIKVPSQEEYTDLQDPPEAKGSCAQGILPSASRFVLQAEPEMLGMDSSSSSSSNQDESQDLPEKLLFASLSLLRPVLRFLAGLGNPYKRDTYRYTPLLAVILAPGELLNKEWSSAFFGKSIFILADILVALLMWDIMDLRRTQRSTRQSNNWLAGLLWLCNPFTAQISTRGSSESVLGVLVLGFLDMTLRSYPETNLLVEVEANGKLIDMKDKNTVQLAADDTKWSNSALMAPFLFAFSIHWKLYPIIYAAALVPHLNSSESIRGVFRFGIIAIYSLACISIPVWAIWGPPYLEHTIFYHFYRSDHRHNFSPHFLSSYLASLPVSYTSIEGWHSIISQLIAMSSSLAFLPQLGLTAYLGFSIGSHDLVAAITFQTMAFVAFNKVCTSQYYMWIIWFLPIVAPFLHFSRGSKQVVSLVSTWVLAQAIWLSQAYLLEFKAQDVFLRVWLASLLLQFVHIWLLLQLVQAWADGRQLKVKITQETELAVVKETEKKKTS